MTMTDAVAKAGVQPVEGPRIILRPVRMTDALDVYRNIRGNEIGKWSGPSVHPSLEGPVGQALVKLIRYTGKAIRLLFSAFCRPGIPSKYSLAIVLRETNRVIGMVTLSRIKGTSDRVDIGFWVGRSYWGQGFTTDAVQLAMKIGFEQLGLSTIDAWTFEKNIGSKRVMEKCGFRLDSVIKDAYIKYNEGQTRLNYTIQKSEYAATRVDGR